MKGLNPAYGTKQPAF